MLNDELGRMWKEAVMEGLRRTPDSAASPSTSLRTPEVECGGG
jgi:hypothetical protein